MGLRRLTSTIPLAGYTEALESVLRLARQYGAVRVTMPDGLAIELADAGPAPSPSAAAGVAGVQALDAKCRCGHSLAAEHNEHGCLRGCDLEACASAGEPVPE